jgi:hypothetical protein
MAALGPSWAKLLPQRILHYAFGGYYFGEIDNFNEFLHIRQPVRQYILAVPS